MAPRFAAHIRHLAIVCVFCLVCVIYLGKLFHIQIIRGEPDSDGDTNVRTVTVQAVRGEIYDRNGKPLVTNRYTYDLTLSYSTLAASGIRASNEACLHLSRAMREVEGGGTPNQKFFPFEGSYPYYSFSAEVQDRDSVEYYRLQRVLKAIGLKEDAKIADIVKYYVTTYDLLAEESDGKRVYDNGEVDSLLRLRYDMDAQDFKASGEYLFAHDVSIGLMAYVKELSLSGLGFTVNAERVYNYPGYASHILGTVGPIYSEEWDYYNEQGYQMNAVVGKSGCEYAFESYLRGSDGKLRIEEDKAGNILKVEVLTEPVAGNDVHLTIDIDLQIAAEDGLRDNVAYITDRAGDSVEKGCLCQAGAAVAIDPETFDILAIASYPTFDLNTYNADYAELLTQEGKPLFNRALNGLYAPGSTYKPGMAIAAMMEGEIDRYSTIVCNQKYTRYDDYQPECSTHPHPYGSSYLTASQAIADSCNCFFYELGYRLGIDRITEYMSKLGIGQSTGLELGGQNGRVASADHWLGKETAGLTLQASIGQADNLASPLQLACYTAALTNGGTRYSAHLLNGVYAFGSSSPLYAYQQTEATVLDRLAIPDTALSTVLGGMADVVRQNDVVSRFLSDIPAHVIGKTGTAQNSTGCDNALFVCAAYEEESNQMPDVVISVVIEQGYTGGYASFTAGRILDAFYQQ